MRKLIIPALLVIALGCAKMEPPQAPVPPTPITTKAKDQTTTDPGITKHVTAKPNDAAVTLALVKYDQLTAAIKEQRGKIVVVDIWSTTCVPCIAEFPNLVKLHQEHAKDGVVCMSVTIDEPGDKDKALKFLQKQNATFANFLIDEPVDVWQKKWGIEGVPAVFVIGRDGHQAAKFDRDDDSKPAFTYKDVNKKVDELLRGQQ